MSIEIEDKSNTFRKPEEFEHALRLVSARLSRTLIDDVELTLELPVIIDALKFALNVSKEIHKVPDITLNITSGVGE